MDLTSFITLSGMVVVGLVCVTKTDAVATHMLRQSSSLRGKTVDIVGLKKQLRKILFYGGWFLLLVSIVLGLAYNFAP